MIDKPGVYTMTAGEYHADPCPEPSLSSSLARILLSKSPRHARLAHPKLNPDFVRTHAEKFDLGSAAHAHLLEGESGFVIVNAEDWRTNKAKEARAAAWIAGKVPLLSYQWADVQAMVTAANRQLDEPGREAPRPFTGGKPEQVLIWREGDVWCRARLDYLHDDHQTIDDYKSTGESANPDTWTRTMFNMGFDVQDAFYRRGVKAVFGVDAAFRFIVQENYGAYELAVIALDPMGAELAERKVIYAINRWHECLATKRWEGYPLRTCWAEPPPWELTRWTERESREGYARDEAARPIDDGRPLAEQLTGDPAS